MMNCQEYREIVAAHVDNVLTPLEREEAEHHVASCAACRKMYEQERTFRAFVATKPLLQKVPPALEQKLRSALIEAESESRWSRLQEIFTFPRLAMGLAAAGLLALLFLPRLFEERGNEDFLQRAAQDYVTITSPGFSLAFHTDDPQALEVYFNQSGSLDFKTWVLDFRKPGYRLKGGTIMKEGEKMVAVTLYEGQKGYILCRRFRGTLSFLPPGGERMGDHLSYTRGDLTFCFMQEGEMVCSLTTRIPRETFVHDLEAVLSQTHEEAST
jgi:anti-sigma factor RsiW